MSSVNNYLKLSLKTQPSEDCCKMIYSFKNTIRLSQLFACKRFFIILGNFEIPR